MCNQNRWLVWLQYSIVSSRSILIKFVQRKKYEYSRKFLKWSCWRVRGASWCWHKFLSMSVIFYSQQPRLRAAARLHSACIVVKSQICMSTLEHCHWMFSLKNSLLFIFLRSLSYHEHFRFGVKHTQTDTLTWNNISAFLSL